MGDHEWGDGDRVIPYVDYNKYMQQIKSKEAGHKIGRKDAVRIGTVTLGIREKPQRGTTTRIDIAWDDGSKVEDYKKGVHGRLHRIDRNGT